MWNVLGVAYTHTQTSYSKTDTGHKILFYHLFIINSSAWLCVVIIHSYTLLFFVSHFFFFFLNNFAIDSGPLLVDHNMNISEQLCKCGRVCGWI